MTAPLRWGILGVAKINERLVPAFRASATADLRAIASRDAARSKQAAADAGVPVGHAGYQALLDDPKIDAVYVPLPNHLHAEWVRKAADAGKHVLCEKPLTVHAPEAAEVVAYCRSKGVRLMDGFMWPHHPRTAKLRKFLDDSGIGEVRRAHAAFSFVLPVDPSAFRYQPAAGGGSLLDVGCYCIFGLRWAMRAEPVRVTASATYVHDVDHGMAGLLEFADGRSATFSCGFDAPLCGWLEVTGSSGVVRVNDMWLPGPEAAFEVTRDDKPVEVVKTPGSDQIVCMLDDFAAAVREGREPVPPADEAVKTAKVMDALLVSARERRLVVVG